MRLFVAIPVPDSVKAALETCARGLGREPALARAARWVKLENLHVTLKFMGEVEEPRLEALTSALEAGARGLRRGTVRVQGLGAFPDARRPRVLWAGIRDDSGTLAGCAQSVEEAAVSAGFPPQDKPFSAHLTLARFSAPPHGSIEETVRARSALDFGEIAIAGMALMQSRLGPMGPDYAELRRFDFV